jgi:predicted DNA-binding transcriptional regulator AlpA
MPKKPRVLLNGKWASIAEHARRRGISYSTVSKRIAAGMTPERALRTPVRASARAMHEGEVVTAKDLMTRLGISQSAAYERLAHENPMRPKRGRRDLPTSPSRKPMGPKPKKVLLDKIEATIAEHAARTGASHTSVSNWSKRTPPRSGKALGPRGPRTKGAKDE